MSCQVDMNVDAQAQALDLSCRSRKRQRNATNGNNYNRTYHPDELITTGYFILKITIQGVEQSREFNNLCYIHNIESLSVTEKKIASVRFLNILKDLNLNNTSISCNGKTLKFIVVGTPMQHGGKRNNSSKRYEDRTVKELVERAKQLKISPSGLKKYELIKKLRKK